MDGAFSSQFSIPNEYVQHKQLKDKVIKISVYNGFANNENEIDIQCKHDFTMKEWVNIPNLNDCILKFKMGYKDAALYQSMFNCMSKGLKLQNNILSQFDFENDIKNMSPKWIEHIENRLTYHENTLKKNVHL